MEKVVESLVWGLLAAVLTWFILAIAKLPGFNNSLVVAAVGIVCGIACFVLWSPDCVSQGGR